MATAGCSGLNAYARGRLDPVGGTGDRGIVKLRKGNTDVRVGVGAAADPGRDHGAPGSG